MKPRNLVVWACLVFICLTVPSYGTQLSTVIRITGLTQEKVKLTPDEFQRLVYSSHVLTVFDTKPELEGSLLALLELQRQNPEASPTSLVKPVKGALEEYREEASSYTLLVIWRDEVLGRYFLKLCDVLQRDEKGSVEIANRREVALNLLKVLLAQEDAPGFFGDQAGQFHAGSQRLLAVARGPGERQALVESCMQRAQSDASFAMAIDALLREEIGIALDAPPGEIFTANPVLGQSPTMQELTRLSSLSEDGSVVITMDKLKDLFAAETAVVQEAVTTHQALDRQISEAQEDLVRYPDNATRVAEMIHRQVKEQAGQTERIAASSATARALSNMALPQDPGTARGMDIVSKTCGLLGSALAQLGGGTANPLGAVGGIFSLVDAGMQFSLLFVETGPPPEETILDSIKLVGEMISDLSEQMEYRFDRVDRSLLTILGDLRRMVILVGEVGHDVDEVRGDLLEAQASLYRLERELHSYLNAAFRRPLVERINGDLGFEARTGESMPWESYLTAENTFYSWAFSHAEDDLSSPRPPADADINDMNLLDDMKLLEQLESRPLESNLNYIREFLRRRLGLAPLSKKPVANPRDWHVGANAYLQLAAENPQHFRRINPQRLDNLIQTGAELEDFFRAITFVKSGSDSKVNRVLYDAVLAYYESKLQAFDKAVEKVEAAFDDRGKRIDVSMWRKLEARKFTTVTETAINGVEGYIRRMPVDVIGVAAGVYHSLAIRTDGSVVAWGTNYSGQCNVPADLSDVIAVSAGASHSLALKKDGTIVAWGNNHGGKCDIPAHEAITKICAGPHHSLALRADGRVIAWGDSWRGACDVPEGLTGVIDIAATGDPQQDSPEISLALKADGTVVAWGGGEGLEGVSNVVAIAAGYGRGIAVKDDGTVIGWKVNDYNPTSLDAKAIDGVTGVTAVALGERFTLALKKDGTVEVIDGSIEVTPETGGIVAIAAGRDHWRCGMTEPSSRGERVPLVGWGTAPRLSQAWAVAMKAGSTSWQMVV